MSTLQLRGAILDAQETRSNVSPIIDPTTQQQMHNPASLATVLTFSLLDLGSMIGESGALSTDGSK
jgi:hypothetical protein